MPPVRDLDAAVAVEELRSFVGLYDGFPLDADSRLARYLLIARRAVAGWETAPHTPSRDERLRTLARETRAFRELP